MAHLEMNAANVSHITWDGEEKAKAEFFAMMDNHRKEMEEMEISRMQDEGEMHPVTPVKLDVCGSSEDQEERESLDEEFIGKLGEEEKEALRDSGFNVDTDPNDPLAPYWNEELNIAFKMGGAQINFGKRLGRDIRSAVKVLFAQQKGTKFPYTIQRIVQSDNGTEYVDLEPPFVIHYPSGTKSAFKGASAGTSKRSTGKTAEQLAEEERKRQLAEEERKRKEQAKLEKAEQKRKTEEAAKLQAALKAALNCPDEFNKHGEPSLAYIYFHMLHRPQGATYGELGAVNNTVNGGFKTPIRGFANTYNKVILAQHRKCAAKSHGVNILTPYKAYKLIDRNRDALSNIPDGWALDPDTYPNGLAHFDLD